MQPIEINKHQFFKIELLEVPYTCPLSTSYMPEIKPIKVLQILAGMVELVDTLASGATFDTCFKINSIL